MRRRSADSIVARCRRTSCNKAGYKAANRSCHVDAMNKKVTKFPPEVRERAVRLVREQRSEHPSMRAAVESIAPMIGCTPQTLHEWVKRDQIDPGERDRVTSDEREHLKALEREVKELRRANEILKVASAFFDQAELDRRFKS